MFDFSIVTSWVHELLTSFMPLGLAIFIECVIVGLCILLMYVVVAILMIFMERKVCAAFQCRLGPMRVGPWGTLQVFADVFKMLTKEIITIRRSDKFLYNLAPYIVILASVLAFSCLPFNKGMEILDFNVGVFFMMAASSIGIVGILLAGWSSNNKYSLIGAMRSGAQMISYELSIGLSILTIVVLTDTMQFSEIVARQADGWFIFKGHVPALVAFVIYLIAGNAEVNRVLGGGLVPGSLVLLGGEPGIGKSTLSLQIALADNGLKTLYVSGEESAEQIKMRALRLGIGNEGCLIYAETLLENILAQIEEQRPDLVVIDSIQTIYTDIIESSAGSVSQIRECAASLLKYAKATGTSIFIIGHITKDGTIAGPKILEHIVDVVLQFEGDNNLIYRILRGIKNRFGATFEIGVFEMLDAGLREVDNPSEILLSHYETPLSGIAVGASVDGIRPYLIEVQALVSNAAYGTPQRTATGYDNKRMNMLLAVLEKRVGMKLSLIHI